jgi:thioredoxin 1
MGIAMQAIDDRSWSNEVLNLSRRTPILVNFGAPWCGLCKVLQPLLNQFEPHQAGQVKLVNINTDENLKLANTYQITTLPTLLLVVDGKIVQRLEQFRNPDDLRQSLEQIVIPAETVSA